METNSFDKNFMKNLIDDFKTTGVSDDTFQMVSEKIRNKPQSERGGEHA